MDKATRSAAMDAVNRATMMDQLEAIARWQKYPGSQDEIESLRYIEQQAASSGLRTQILFHDAYISLPGAARIEVAGDTMECITHSFSRSSPAGGLEGRLVDVGRAGPDDLAGNDLRGCIALVDGLATPATAVRLTAAGAAGQLHVSPDEHRHEMTLSPVWGNPGGDTRSYLPRTVACTVARSDGGRLRARLAAGEALRVVLHAEVDTRWRAIPILIADLDAEAPTDESFVLFSGHHDTWHYGVMDNGTANVTMLEVARIAALHRDRLRRGLKLAFWSGHSQGRYAGSTWYADAFWSDLDRNCVLHVNIDSTGGRDNRDFVSLSGPEFWTTAKAAMAEVSDEPIHLKRLGRFGDQSFWGIGIPALLAFGEQPPSSGMHAHFPHPLGWWWHTTGDTLDKIDPDILVRDARFYVNVVMRALCEPVLPFDFAAAVDELGLELEKLADSLFGWLDLSPLTSRLSRLTTLLGQIDAAAARGADARTNAINRAFVGISRAIVPMQFTTGDRFGQDPALPQPAFPPLDPLRRLAGRSEDAYEARFLAVDALRARNRVAHALDLAIAALDKAIVEIG
ncbi:peptidase M28 [Mesorhizobium sp. L-8-10]|uniref:M28 family peptidase n=1 Tax=Mesorhizobium sp. L-8-10 TaxID=2744523 RepID=UPI001927C5AD|nr:M28 family peptidase [Mesorhizobium sp. L-8-10]BCH29359.1 peptidase M28 [Mesorhizobium sp. L-8-10]